MPEEYILWSFSIISNKAHVLKCKLYAQQLLNGRGRQDDCGATRVNLGVKMIKKTLVRVVTDVASVRQDSLRHECIRSCAHASGRPEPHR